MQFLNTTNSKVRMNLTGGEGNAFYLVSYAKQFAEQLGYNKDEKDAMVMDMTSSDYQHLISVFNRHFNMIVTLYI